MHDHIILIVTFFASILGIYSFIKSQQLTANLKKREADIGRRMYQLAILKELGERIGYSLNIQKVPLEPIYILSQNFLKIIFFKNAFQQVLGIFRSSQ